MRVTAIDSMLTNIFQSIPSQILEMTYNPTEMDSSLDGVIINKLLNPVVHKDVSLLTGKLKTIILLERDRRPTYNPVFGGQLGTGIESEFYEVSPHQRENRDIAFIIGPCNTLSQPYFGGGESADNGGMFTGNTVLSTAQFLLNTRTLARSSIAPDFDIAGSNVIRVTPRLMASPFMLDVLLGYDYEYSNAEPSVIVALTDLALIACKRDIYTRMAVTLDQGAVIAGSEIGAFKDIILTYQTDPETYRDAVLKVQKAGQADIRRMNRSLYYRL